MTKGLEITVAIVVVFMQATSQAYPALRKEMPPRGGSLNDPSANPDATTKAKRVPVSGNKIFPLQSAEVTRNCGHFRVLVTKSPQIGESSSCAMQMLSDAGEPEYEGVTQNLGYLKSVRIVRTCVRGISVDGFL